jgi:hypothetical protein
MNKDSNMDPTNRKNDVDEWLDSALGQYSNAQPRAGLESRILANLQAERRRLAERKRWWWASAGTMAAAAAIALAVWLGHTSNRHSPNEPSLTAKHDAQSVPRTQVSPEVHPITPPTQYEDEKDCVVMGLFPVEARRSPAHRHQATEVRSDEPRLAQFPAPAPLSDQEKLLARYVEQFPQRAALIARAQTDLRQQTELEMAAPWPRNADFNHQEQQQ